MKKLLFTIPFAVLAISCSIESDRGLEITCGEVAVLAAEAEQPVPATKTSLLPGNVVSWNADDCLSILSAGANDIFTVKSVSPDNPGSATFSGKITTGKKEYFALYPYDEAAKYDGSVICFRLPAVQKYAKDSFGSGAFPCVARFTTADLSLQFKNICGIFKLVLTGDGVPVDKIVVMDNAGTALWGNATLANDDRIGTENQTLEISGGDNSITLDCSGAGVTLSSTGTVFDFVVPSGAFLKGFTAYVYSNGSVYTYLTNTRNNLVVRSSILAMPAVEAKKPEGGFNLSLTGSANSYVVCAAGDYRFNATKGCTAEAVVPASVGVIWESDGTTAAPAAGSIVSGLSYSDGYVRFNASGKPGNALIAAFSEAGCKGSILWSWHIWCSMEPLPVHIFPCESKVRMMDRNLGALGNSVEDGALAAGLLYQWGRKDPFMGAATIAAAGQKTTPPQQAAVTCMSGYEFGAVDNQSASCGTVEYSVIAPTTFIGCANGYNDNDWLVGHDKSLWTPDKGAYDPCPVGYRVPDQGRNWAWTDDVVFDSVHRGYMFFGREWTVESGYMYRCTGEWCGGYDGMYELWACSAGTDEDAYYCGLHADKNAVTAAISTAKKSNAYGLRCCVDMAY